MLDLRLFVKLQIFTLFSQHLTIAMIRGRNHHIDIIFFGSELVVGEQELF